MSTKPKKPPEWSPCKFNHRSTRNVGPQGRDDTAQPRHPAPGPEPRAEEDDVHTGGAERVHELLTS